ncbi:hypothetical protein [Streptomyces sp. PU-14G]|uniref:hypothetical protein n=1 Tax=Streptomyces sp. PU-14G TaxID=2800808 RepID=UPI0034DFD660
MYYDPVNTLVATACLRQPVVFQHRLSGSYFKQSGDLQLTQETLTGKKEEDKDALWTVEPYLLTSDGTVAYRIKNVGSEQVMAIKVDENDQHKRPIDQPILFQEPTDDRDNNSIRSLSQLWLLQPVEDNGHVISPARFPELSLGPYNRSPATVSGCDRIPEMILPNGGDNDCWLHHHRVQPYPKPQKDPGCHANCLNC